jgi:dTDP-4-amino-4,6-dideoxygalactose transaminase
MSVKHAIAHRIAINDLSRSWIAMSDEGVDAVERVLHSGRYLLGDETAAFEEELAAFIGAASAISVASGTDALVLAMLGVGLGADDEVIVAANAGGYGSIAAAQVGTPVVYADVDPRTACLTPATVESAIGPRTRAVVVTHLYGNVADVPAIAEICDAAGVSVIEDCAQAIGGELDGQRAGSMGDIAAFSFYPTKNLGAAGDGGAVLTSDAALASRVQRLRQYGWGERYHIETPGGRNSRIDEVQAALLRVGLRTLDEQNSRRAAILEHLRSSTPRVDWITGSTATVAHLAVLRARDRDQVRAGLDERGIGTDIHYPVPDHQQPGLPPSPRPRPLPETETLASEILTVPCHPYLSDRDVGRVAQALAEVV